MLVDRLFCMVGQADPNSVCSNIVILSMNSVAYQAYMMWPYFEAKEVDAPPPNTPRADTTGWKIAGQSKEPKPYPIEEKTTLFLILEVRRPPLTTYV